MERIIETWRIYFMLYTCVPVVVHFLRLLITAVKLLPKAALTHNFFTLVGNTDMQTYVTGAENAVPEQEKIR
jgi:hypothetical protein